MSNGPLIFPPNSPLYRQSLVTVDAVDEFFDPTKVTYEPEIGGIYKGKVKKYTISWENDTEATGYNVYGSFSPTRQNLLNTTGPLPAGTISYDFYPPIIPEDWNVYFWVSKIVNAVEIFIQEDPADYNTTAIGFGDTNVITKSQDFPTNCGVEEFMNYASEEIKRRHTFMIENGGEDCHLFIRKWYGTPCQCSDGDASDPDYQGRGRCALCFGTGVFAGFFPKIVIKMRYQNLPIRDVKHISEGLTQIHDWSSWTLWSPKMHNKDIIVRTKTSEHFEVTGVKQSEVRGVPFHQEMDLTLIDQNDIRSSITDEAILEAFKKESEIGFKRFGWEIFN